MSQRAVNRLPPTHWTVNFMHNDTAFVSDDDGNRAMVPPKVARLEKMAEKIGCGFTSYAVSPPPDLQEQKGVHALKQIAGPVAWDYEIATRIEQDTTGDLRGEVAQLIKEVDERLDRLHELCGLPDDD